MIVWVPDVSNIVVPNKTQDFFNEFQDYVSVRQFVYEDFIEGTPFKGDAYFGNGTLVKQHMPNAGSFSDIVRMLVLNKHGGGWLGRLHHS